MTEIPTESLGRYARRLLRSGWTRVAAASPVKVSLERGPEVRIIVNGNVAMSRGKYAAQAVHAALQAFDVPHGRVVVLGGKPPEILQMDVQVRDAGRTELAPGTLTAGCSLSDESS